MQPPLFARIKPAAAVPRLTQPQPVVAPEAPEAPTLEKKTGEPGRSGPPAPPAQEERPPANSALETAAGELDGESLRAYSISVAVGVARLYGAQPPHGQLTGRVTLRATVGPAGRGVEVAASSGRAAVDEEARALVARALAATPLPAGLRGHSVSFEVPVIFGGGQGG